ncbi:Svx/AvrXca family virulence/avirulence protein [Dickeya fangzhongdai]|uniref:Svx/AvrXca family virulence/avirulence protein n=1 Tax=Dickeya fangzhongdai TaxID=1778540 RepID=UPI0023E40F79|nr:Svx/AvrXca family virulence/avirulence protein [Dickeya fangzhongdai]WES88952.1 Svx/AvrXca family virulence/avirulence protein [Dickeya fangzhongdai]
MSQIRKHISLGRCLLAAGSLLAANAAYADETCTTAQWQTGGASDMPPVQYQTEHFAFRWKDSNNSQIDRNNVVAASRQLELTWNQYMTKVKFPEPYCNSNVKYKANVHIDPTFGLNGSLTEEGAMGMWIGTGSLLDHWGLAHEFAHSLQGMSGGFQSYGRTNFVGWIWESHANWMAQQLDEFRGSNAHCSEMLVNYPHLYLGSTRDRYCNWQFMENLKNRYGYSAVNDLWTKAPKPGSAEQNTTDPISVLKSNMGWSQSELNDFFGDWAMRNVNWDYTDPDGYDRGSFYRRTYGGYGAVTPSQGNADKLLRTTALDPVSASGVRRFAVPFDQAPQRWGYNIVRLIPDSGATKVTVSFQGIVQSAPAVNSLPGLKNDPVSLTQPDSDWRWGLVAIDSAGKSRYSALQRGASAKISNFAVKSTDKGLYLVVMGSPSQMHQITWDQAYYSLYRYPWTVDLTNAWAEGSQPNAPTPTANGRRHSNGGGWVANGAEVASTAYVGPYARVIGGKVLDYARIEDHATVLSGTVSGNARVSGLTVVQGDTVIKDNAQVNTVFKGPGAFERGVVVSGTAQLRGDAEIRGVSTSRGVFYGFIDENEVKDSRAGANLTDAVPEVTERPAYAR